MNFIITSVSVIMAIDQTTGDEGVWGFKDPAGNWMPMVCADEERLRWIYPVAQKMAAATGAEFKVLKFTNRVDITEETKEKYK